MPSPETRDWRVLLIGGASGVGKTRLSEPLARGYGVNLVAVDDVQAVLEVVTTPETHPLLHFWRTNWPEYSALNAQARLEHTLRVAGEVFAPALEAVVAQHLESRSDMILEGDFILPEFALRERYGDQTHDGRVRALFVLEDENQIASNYLSREGEPQLERAHSSWNYSQWLRSECARLNLPTIGARPWETMLERAIRAIENPNLPI